MSYTSAVEMSVSPGLVDRIIACTAQFVPDPVSFSQSRIHAIVGEPAWATAWETAKGKWAEVQNYYTFTTPSYPDLGKLEDVITDDMIVAQVQAVLAEQPAPSGE